MVVSQGLYLPSGAQCGHIVSEEKGLLYEEPPTLYFSSPLILLVQNLVTQFPQDSLRPQSHRFPPKVVFILSPQMPSLHRLPVQDFLGLCGQKQLFSVCEEVWGWGREGVNSSVGIWRSQVGC
uniref:Uncharacterized protein n=1 Tax=Myotis myotis TaxID=51298 RepID=A0A7J7SRC0_MYOMY|nr:hypothetical protein mMyoMyo1_009389 [Myotis myotis]